MEILRIPQATHASAQLLFNIGNFFLPSTLYLLCAHHFISVLGRTGRPKYSFSSSSYVSGNTLGFMFCRSRIILVAFLWTLFYWSMFIFKNVAQNRTDYPSYGLPTAKQMERISSFALQKIFMLSQYGSCLFASVVWHISQCTVCPDPSLKFSPRLLFLRLY